MAGSAVGTDWRPARLSEQRAENKSRKLSKPPTSLEVESYLGGEATFLRNTYFGEWILTPERLASWHEESVAPVRQRWQPEVHQVVDAERRVREALGEAESWALLAQSLREGAKLVVADQKASAPSLARAVAEAAIAAEKWATKLTETLAALRKGDLNLLQQLGSYLARGSS